MAADGALESHIPVAWMSQLDNLPEPPDIMSERIKHLLGRALMKPATLAPTEIQELAASVVFHLIKVREEEEQRAE